jgi:hypothetical protein
MGALSLPAEGGGPSLTVEGECGTFKSAIVTIYTFSLLTAGNICTKCNNPSRKEPLSEKKEIHPTSISPLLCEEAKTCIFAVFSCFFLEFT